MADKRIIDLTAETALTRSDTFLESDHATRGSEKVSVENVLLRDQNNQTGVAYTLVLTDSQKRLTMSNGSANAITVPPNASVAFPINTIIPILQLGAGQTSLVAGSGVTVNSLNSSLKMSGQFGQSILVKTATNVWSLINTNAETFANLLVRNNDSSQVAGIATVRGQRSDTNTSPAAAGGMSLESFNTSGATVVNEHLGSLYFGANHTAGSESNILGTASIAGVAEGTFSNATTMPSGIAFRTGTTGQAVGVYNTYVGAAERMRIDSSGNVGIGTASPSRPLTLAGDAEINVSGSSNSSKAIVINSSGTNFESDAGIIQGTHAGSGSLTGGYWLKFNANSADKFTVKGNGDTASAGNVGMSSGNSTGKFAVGATSVHASYGFYNQNNAYFNGAVTVDDTLVVSGDANFDSGTLFVDVSANRVGVGNTSPGTILDINDDASTGTGLRVTGGGGGGPLATFTRDVSGGTSGTVVINSASNDPQIRFTSGTDNWSIGLDSTVFNICDGTAVGANQRLVIDTSGNVGIGTTSLSGLLTVGDGHIYQNKTGSGAFPGTTDTTSHGFMAESQGAAGSTIHVSRTNSAAGVFARQGTGDVIVFNNTNSSVTEAGSIEITGATSVAYRTSSDYRLKENVVDVSDGINRVKQLNPVRFNFIGEDPVVDGFLAHEVQDVVPEAIGGEKDGMKDEEYEVSPAVYEDVVHPAVEAVYEDVVHPAVEATYDEDGNELTSAVEEYTEQVLVTEAVEEWTESVLVTEAVMDTRSVPDYQGIDQSKLVPLLTAALQEAVAKIEALEARVANLEA